MKAQGVLNTSHGSVDMVSESSVENVASYIENQEEHHKKITFEEEFLLLLQKHKISYDEKYIWD